MKRSEINRLIRENEQFIAGMGFHLPPFAGYTPEEWREKDHSYDEIRERMLGWDVTDYGKGDFHKIGLFLFTLRNGTFGDPHCPKTYAEKLLISEEDQYAPMHFHFLKTEDIINRGGGNLVVELYKSTPEEELDHRWQGACASGRRTFGSDTWRERHSAAQTLSCLLGGKRNREGADRGSIQSE